jgi:stage II sporulation protein M
VSYTGSTPALGAGRQGSIPCTPTKKKLIFVNRFLNFYRQLFRENRTWLRVILIWFGLTFLLGAIVFYFLPGLLATIIKVFEQKFGASPDLNISLAKDIFLNNLVASSVALFGGIILGLGSFLVVGVNGFILGFVLTSLFALSTQSFLKTVTFIFASLLPHGIFELLAFFVAGALGLRLGLEWLGINSKGKRWKTLKDNLVNGVIFVPVLVLILFLAALIEVFVTGKIVNNF